MENMKFKFNKGDTVYGQDDICFDGDGRGKKILEIHRNKDNTVMYYTVDNDSGVFAWYKENEIGY